MDRARTDDILAAVGRAERLDDNAAAARLLGRLLAADPADLPTMARLARALRHGGLLDEARPLLERAAAAPSASQALRMALVDTCAAIAVRDRDWRALERAWNPVLAQTGGLPITAADDPAVPAGLIRTVVSAKAVHYGFGPHTAAARPYAHDVAAARMLRYSLFWGSMVLLTGHPFAVLFDPSDGEGDHPAVPRVAFSGRGPDTFLIPDFNYVTTAGYAKILPAVPAVPWAERRPAILWRGAPTGPMPASGQWADLPRVRLCRMAGGALDAGLHRLTDTDRFGAPGRTGMAPLLRDPVPSAQYGRWRYLVDIDGHTNAWSGLFQRLASGSPVLKVASAGSWRQWYYDRLRPWGCVVPVAADLSDLLDKAAWLDRHQDDAQTIGQAGRDLARSLDWTPVMRQAAATVAAAARALRAFEG